MAQYGSANPVYEANGTSLVNRIPQGGRSSSFRDMLMGTQGGFNRLDKYDPDQMMALKNLLSQSMGGLNQFDFAPIEQQARSNFENKTLPSIAERFTSMGGQGSSAFAQMLGAASSDLEGNLAAMKQQYNLQREPLLQNLLNMGLRERFDMSYQPGSQGLLQSGTNAFAGGLGSALGAGLTGGLGRITDLLSQFSNKQPSSYSPTNFIGRSGQFKPSGFGYSFQ